MGAPKASGNHCMVCLHWCEQYTRFMWGN